MLPVLVRPFWQQKHPTATSASWDFHWHPADLPADVRQAIGAMDLPLGGGDGCAVLVTPGYAVVARTYEAIVPSEQRRYVGTAGLLVRPVDAGGHWGSVLPGALVTAAAHLPDAAPVAATARPPIERVVEAARLPLTSPGPELTAVAPTADALGALARALVAGGRAVVTTPRHPAVPALLGRLLTWIPEDERVADRCIVLGPPDRSIGTEPLDGGLAGLVHYLALAWAAPAAATPDVDEAAVTWRLVLDAAAGVGIVALFDELGRLAEAWDAADGLWRYLRASVLPAADVASCDAASPSPLYAAGEPDAGTLWNRILHHWGRGLLGGAGLEARLARVLALRVLVDHLVALDDPGTRALPGRYLRRLRYEALLPADRVAALGAAVVRALPGLAAPLARSLP